MPGFLNQDPGSVGGSFLNPERIVASFGLQPGDHVADFGAGHGYFTIPMARAVGGDGKVFALDIQKSVLEVVRAAAAREHLFNIETRWADLDEPGGSRLREQFIDFVLIASILFQAEAKHELFQEANRIICEGGRLAVVEWTPESPMGPPHHIRVTKETAEDLAKGAGFTFLQEFDAGAHHYGLMFRK